MKILKVNCAYTPEKFIKSFGFKGSTLSGVWQTVVCLYSDGCKGIGVGVQSVLWSDSNVFANYGEQRSNEMMYSVTEYAAELVKNIEFENPADVVKSIFARCRSYAETVTGMKVTDTFVLNALVPLDFAVWQLWARTHGIYDFDKVYKGPAKQRNLANIPLITYSTSLAEIAKMAEDGVCIFKIKLGADPDGDGDLDKMLEWDKRRALEIHNLLKSTSTAYTDCGSAVYYFDANGRYDTKERLSALVEFMQDHEILERTVLFEEPFAPDNKIYLGDLPVNFAADESAHSLEDVKERISLGYNTITLKPIAKTITVTIDMVDYATKSGAQCFCADLTVNPFMVQWNKNFAARMTPLKGMKIGVLESNGSQNYVNWQRMKTYVKGCNAECDETIYNLDDVFYHNGGGVFEVPDYYENLVSPKREFGGIM